MTRSGEVLVAVISSDRDLTIARTQHWYRIPIEAVKNLSQPWEPQWLAFYQTKVFGDEAYAIRYYASVEKIGSVDRAQLFPDEPQSAKSQKQYYKLELAPFACLPQPIFSQKLRRVTFIQTTIAQLKTAIEIKDLYR